MESKALEYVLQFISGKYRGGEFPLEPGKEVLIGRSSELDMVLVEDMVSRKHARITFENGEIFIHDLGSTNGTFVNGERIKKKKIVEGDRILVGTSILKLAQKGAAQPTGIEMDSSEEEDSPPEPPPDDMSSPEDMPPPPPDMDDDGLGGIEIPEDIEEEDSIPEEDTLSDELPVEKTDATDIESLRREAEVTPLPFSVSDGLEEPPPIPEDEEIEIEPQVAPSKPAKTPKSDALDSVLDKKPKEAPPQRGTDKSLPAQSKKGRGKATMSGQVEEVAVPDLIQLFSLSKKSGTCYIDQDGDTAKLYLKDGKIYYALIESAPDIEPYKAALRILTWDRGTFSMCQEEPITVEKEITAGVNNIVMDAMAQKDEIGRLAEAIPAFDKRINIVIPPRTPFRELKPEALDALECALQAATVQDIMNRHPKSDKDALQGLSLLVEAGVVELE